MSSLLRSAHRSDGLHCLSCTCQRGPDRSWMARQMLLLFSYWHNWHGRILTADYFEKVLLLCRSLTQFPCAQTCCISPCRTFLKSTIPGCRIVLTNILERRVIESLWALQSPSSWWRSIQVIAEVNYLITLVILQISWTGDLKVSSLRASWRASSCWAHWGVGSNLEKSPWYVLGVYWLYCQIDLRWHQIISELPCVTPYVGIDFFL